MVLKLVLIHYEPTDHVISKFSGIYTLFGEFHKHFYTVTYVFDSDIYLYEHDVKGFVNK